MHTESAPTDRPAPPRSTWWIDITLAAGATALAWFVHPVAGLVVLSCALVLPAQRVLRRPRDRRIDVDHLLPDDVRDAARAFRAEAARASAADREPIMATVDALLVDMAIVLGGQAPKGAAQRRFVATRVQYLLDETTSLLERREAFEEALAEVERVSASVLDSTGALDPGAQPVAAGATGPEHCVDGGRDPSDVEDANRVLVALVVAMMFPFFAVWEVGRVCVDIVEAFVEGVALRVRAACRVLATAARTLGAAGAGALRRCIRVRHHVLTAVRDARRRLHILHLQIRRRRGVPRSLADRHRA